MNRMTDEQFLKWLAQDHYPEEPRAVTVHHTTSQGVRHGDTFDYHDPKAAELLDSLYANPDIDDGSIYCEVF